MPLFQQSVIKKHLEACDAKHIEERWSVFKSIFYTAEKQANIRASKEEQYQEGFLRDLFVNVLGYTINPEPNFNLLTEQKNVNNSKKADGAILVGGKVLAVIELKGTETTDLNKIETQAFGYKNNQPGCNYVITSNFEKLRFYIDNTTQQEEFNLFTLTKPQFELLYACLAWDSIKNNVPNHLLNESVSKENTITKLLYKDYSEFKRALFLNLVELNPQFDKLVLFKKTQKLLDRFLFIFFAEDRGLLPTNLIFRINKEWENILAQRMQVSLYDRYKMYFNDLNVGAKVTLPAFGKKTGEAITAEFEIFAYNGGLFVPDEILDNINIEDSLLHAYTQKMSHYNFESDVDVNILGHIFENSLNEIDEIKSELEGNVLEKTKTRRKKDGVFYTPKYITKYIVENTVGKLCTEKKEAIKLVDEDYMGDFEGLPSSGLSQQKTSQLSQRKIAMTKKKILLDKLNEYRSWLLDLTICDPACGSGAFLNQALEFLIAEHRYVDELQAKLLGDSLVFSDVEKNILERNLYGVDLNEESVEIAKLSLWLRTAQKGRKLNSLNNNIKCGNSLIDDPAVAGEKAFSWEKEFPEVFKAKNKYAYHVTASIHDSRTSQRMIDYHARERRFGGMKPMAEVNYMTKEVEELIATTVSEIVEEDNLNIAAFNLCRDHMHILLVCEEHEVSKIMHKIKGRTARICNAHITGKYPIKGKYLIKGKYPIKGINPLGGKETTNPHGDKETITKLKDGSTPFWAQKYYCNPITSDEYFWNVVNYIEKNKAKHKLPNNPKLQSIIHGFVKSYEECFRTEYTGGFDVVIGNPPYGAKLDSKDWLKANFTETSFGTIDSYKYFVQLGVNCVSPKGVLGYIMPDSYLEKEYFKDLRVYVTNHFRNIKNIKLGDDIFEEVVLPTAIIIVHDKGSTASTFEFLDVSMKLISEKKRALYELNQFILSVPEIETTFISINSIIKSDNNIPLIEVYDQVMGVKVYQVGKGIPKQTTYELDHNIFISKKNDLQFNFPFVSQGIGRYSYESQNEYISYGVWLAEPRKEKYFTEPKIVIREIINPRIFATLIESKAVVKNIAAVIIQKDKEFPLKYLLGLINSKLMTYYINEQSPKSQNKSYPSFNSKLLKNIPIANANNSVKQNIIDKVDDILSKTEFLKVCLVKFSTYFSSHYHLDKLPGKLANWYELEFVDFIKELNKAIKAAKGTPLTKKDEFEWMDLFEENKKKALELKMQIDKTDKEIDQMVYQLYGLTEEEIKIVENS